MAAPKPTQMHFSVFLLKGKPKDYEYVDALRDPEPFRQFEVEDRALPVPSTYASHQLAAGVGVTRNQPRV